MFQYILLLIILSMMASAVYQMMISLLKTIVLVAIAVGYLIICTSVDDRSVGKAG